MPFVALPIVVVVVALVVVVVVVVGVYNTAYGSFNVLASVCVYLFNYGLCVCLSACMRA